MFDKYFFFLFIPFLISLASSYLLLIWFDGAKVFLEYIQLFRLTRFSETIKNYNLVKNQGYQESYLDYISTFYDGFLTRLVTCEKCFSFWITNFLFFYYILMVFTYFYDLGILLLSFTPIFIFALPTLSYTLYKLIKKIK